MTGSPVEVVRALRTEAKRRETGWYTIERVGALRAGIPTGLFGGGGGALAPDDGGDVIVFGGVGDFTEANPDQLTEVWVIDRTEVSRIQVGSESPTTLRWVHESGPLRYDVIRGDVALLADGLAGTVDLGPVTCIEDDSPDADTIGFEDGVDPGVLARVREAIGELEDAGAKTIPVSLPHTEHAIATYYLVATAEASSNLTRFDGVRYGRRADRPEDLRPECVRRLHHDRDHRIAAEIGPDVPVVLDIRLVHREEAAGRGVDFQPGQPRRKTQRDR